MTQLGKYQLIRKLAAGGMAEVFLAKAAGPMGFEKTLVLKRILPHLASEPSFVEMFLSEAKLVAQLNHPNIVQIFDFGEADGDYFLAMEYIDGPNVRELIKRTRLIELPLPMALCARIIASACEGLAFAHEFRDPTTGEFLGIIHRDISPDNILLSSQGAVKVVDFGIAKVSGQSQHTQPGIVKGKISYMAPEQLRARPLDRRADVYALGIVLYELLTGRRPFDKTTDVGMMQSIINGQRVPAAMLRPELPASLLQILDRAIAKEREDRYPDCRAFQADLERFILSTGEPMGAYQIARMTTQLVAQGGGGVMLTPPSGPIPPAVLESASRQKTAIESAPAGGRPPSDDEEPDQGATEPTTPANLDAATESMPVTQALPPPTPPGRARVIIPVALLGAALLGGAYALAVRTPSPPPEPQPITGKDTPDPSSETGTAEPGPVAPPPPLASESADAGPVQTVASVEQLPPGGEEPTAPQQQPVPEAADAGTAPVPQGVTPQTTPGTRKPNVTSTPVPKRKRKGTVEFRIRPYAIVSFDGKILGQSPFAPMEVLEGWHSVRVVNRDLRKDVTRNFEVKPGQLNVFKINLYEE